MYKIAMQYGLKLPHLVNQKEKRIAWFVSTKNAMLQKRWIKFVVVHKKIVVLQKIKLPWFKLNFESGPKIIFCGHKKLPSPYTKNSLMHKKLS